MKGQGAIAPIFPSSPPPSSIFGKESHECDLGEPDYGSSASPHPEPGYFVPTGILRSLVKHDCASRAVPSLTTCTRASRTNERAIKVDYKFIVRLDTLSHYVGYEDGAEVLNREGGRSLSLSTKGLHHLNQSHF